ncbi:MAG TPA: 16S rRNA (cytosine(1402)-N(4))-methyltransferase RsmH [Abditibacteriaceae bacterium]
MAGNAEGGNDQADEAAKGTVEVRPDAVFIDGTLGTAGHTLAMLEAHPTCRVVAFDRDTDSMEIAKERLAAANVLERVTFINGDFRNAREFLQPYFENQKSGADGRPITRIDGALVDAGMSLLQVTWPERGLSFRTEGAFKDAPLDMRYDRTQDISALDLVNRLSPNELEDLIFQFADERWARRITATIVEQRRSKVIETTTELVSLIEAAIPLAVRRQSRVHPATQTFAALRLAVNSEFAALDQGAWALSDVLAPAARLVVLTYSSHEDRTIKRTFRRLAGRAVVDEDDNTNRKKKSNDAPMSSGFRPERSSLTFSLDLPFRSAPAVPAWAEEEFEKTWRMKIVTSKPVEPTDEEISSNPLARSCKLRAVEKIKIE